MSSSMLFASSSRRRCRRSNWRAVSSRSASSTRSSKGSGPASETLSITDWVSRRVSLSFLQYATCDVKFHLQHEGTLVMPQQSKWYSGCMQGIHGLQLWSSQDAQLCAGAFLVGRTRAGPAGEENGAVLADDGARNLSTHEHRPVNVRAGIPRHDGRSLR